MSPVWTTDNRVTLLENGEGFYPRVFEAIAGARQEVLLETFILFDDKVGRQLQQALLQAARAGARVDVLVDGWGSPDLPEDFVRPLTEAGVQLRVFEPARRLFGTRVNLFRRMHRKLVVVDGRIAFVGGINYSIDHLAEFGPKAKQDYAVEVEGPLVAQVQAYCRANVGGSGRPALSLWRRWRAHRSERRAGVEAGGPAASAATAALVWRDNGRSRAAIEQQYRLALRRARRRVIIANAYFFPGYRLLREIRAAAKRGVRVDLILQGAPDMPIVKTVAELLHAHLIRAGVHVHEYCKRPLHGKVAVVDDDWATVGSSNLDPTSLGLNLEANVVLRDRAFASHLRGRLDDLIRESCQEVVLPPVGPLRSAWIQLRSLVVFHFLRRFPAWALSLPQQQPTVALLQAGPR